MVLSVAVSHGAQATEQVLDLSELGCLGHAFHFSADHPYPCTFFSK